MLISRLSALALLLAAALAFSACGDDGGVAGDGAGSASGSGDDRADLEHIHGLGVNPGSDALFVATHYGLFEAGKEEVRLQRVSESRQDIMGFSVAGPGHFIGSGHPDPSQNLPPNLGLIESRDGGETFENVSLLGEADFHVLRSAGRRIYGFNGVTGQLMVSSDGGRRWTSRTPPAGVFDLAIDPSDDQTIVASTEEGLFVSPNAGEGWRPLRDDVAGLLAWPAPDALFLVDGDGQVSQSTNGGKSFKSTGTIGGPPSAFVSHGDDLYAALGDGSVVRSTDAGANWQVRATP